MPEASQATAGDRRTITCACGAAFVQEALGTPTHLLWIPHVCSSCLAHETIEAKAAERAGIARVRVVVPERYRDASLENFCLHGSPADRRRQTAVKSWATNYIQHWPAVPLVIVLQGSFQTGKTHLAWAILRALAQRQVRGKLITVADMVRDLREPWRSKDGPSESERLHRYRRHELLVLDELSAHSLSAKQLQPHLYDVVAYRITEARPTLITTNESDQALAGIVGLPLQARILAEGGVLEFGSEPWKRP